MRKLLPIIFLLMTIIGHSQVNRYSKITTSTYEPRSFDELSRVAMSLQKRYNENQKYLYDMKKWILELKTQISEKKFVERLNGEYSVLTSMEDDDLARATKALKQREMSIRELISEYNIWVKKANSNTSYTSTKSNNSPKNTKQNYIETAINYFQNKNFAKAVSNFSKYLQNDPNNTDILFYRALAKSELNDNYGAIADYEKIMNYNSDYPLTVGKLATVYNNKAYSLVKLKKFKEALPFVNKALEMDKSEWFIWDTRGEIYFNLGNYSESISDLNKAIKIGKHENSYYLRGLAYLESGNKEKGCKDLSKAGELVVIFS